MCRQDIYCFDIEIESVLLPLGRVGYSIMEDNSPTDQEVANNTENLQVGLVIWPSFIYTIL